MALENAVELARLQLAQDAALAIKVIEDKAEKEREALEKRMLKAVGVIAVELAAANKVSNQKIADDLAATVKATEKALAVLEAARTERIKEDGGGSAVLVGKLEERLDNTIKAITKVGIDSLNAIKDLKQDNTRQIDELKNGYSEKITKNAKDLEDLEKRVSTLENWRNYILGITLVASGICIFLSIQVFNHLVDAKSDHVAIEAAISQVK